MRQVVQSGFTDTAVIEIRTKPGNVQKPHLKHKIQQGRIHLLPVQSGQDEHQQAVQPLQLLRFLSPCRHKFRPVAGISGVQHVFTNGGKGLFKQRFLQYGQTRSPRCLTRYFQNRKQLQHTGKPFFTFLGVFGNHRNFTGRLGKQCQYQIEIAIVDASKQNSRCR